VKLEKNKIIMPPINIKPGLEPRFEFAKPYVDLREGSDAVMRVVQYSNAAGERLMLGEQKFGLVSFCKGDPPGVGECAVVLHVPKKENFLIIERMREQPSRDEIINHCVKDLFPWSRWKSGFIAFNGAEIGKKHFDEFCVHCYNYDTSPQFHICDACHELCVTTKGEEEFIDRSIRKREEAFSLAEEILGYPIKR